MDASSNHVSEDCMKIIFEQSNFARMIDIHKPEYAHPNSDSGFDIFSPQCIDLKPGERYTIDLNVKFKIPIPWWMKLLGMSVELHVRPKSGRSKAGLEVSFGTIDNGYRNFIGATIHNYNSDIISIQKNEKICQVVVVPVFTRVKLIEGLVPADTARSLKGFGATGLFKKN